MFASFQSLGKNKIFRCFIISNWNVETRFKRRKEGVDNHHSFIPLDLTLLLSKNKSIYFHLTEDRHSVTVLPAAFLP